MSKEGHARRRNFEYWEYVAGTAITLALLVLDIWLASASEQNASYKRSHEYLEGCLISLIVGFCATMLIRWYRSHDEILESTKSCRDEIATSLERTRCEILDSVELSKGLAQFPDLEDRLSEMARSCIEIQKKEWPPCAREILLNQLDATNNIFATFRAGTIELPYLEAIKYSPSFFQVATGISFVTDYGNHAYWRSNYGKSQLDANKKVINDRGEGAIVRVFIVPPYCSVEDQRHLSLDDLDDILEEQLNAKITVHAVSEARLDEPFRGDVGIFFKDREGASCRLVSKWSKPHSPDHERRAFLSFDGDELGRGATMYTYLVKREHAVPIKSPSDWRTYKDKFGRQKR